MGNLIAKAREQEIRYFVLPNERSELEIRENGEKPPYLDRTFADSPEDAHMVEISFKAQGNRLKFCTIWKSDFTGQTPVRLDASNGDNAFWCVDRIVYKTDPDISAEDVVALVNAEKNKKRLQLQKAHALQAMADQLDSHAQRQPIPVEVKTEVWRRDQGRCVECGSKDNLEFDHIIPLAMGGSNTIRNLQLLCETCNRRKGASLG